MIVFAAFAAALAFAPAAPEPRFVVMRVRVNAYGVFGDGTIAVDRLTGRFVRRFDAGPASEQEGFDGVRAWRADATGMARVQGNSAERGEIVEWSSALVHATTAVTPRAELYGSTDRIHVAFSNYHTFGLLRLPQRIVSTSEQNGVWSANVAGVQTPASVSPTYFTPPARGSRDFQLDRVTRIPISMSGGSPVLNVRVNGHTLHFLFDTGGQNVITRDAAKIAGLPVLGKGAVSGGGGGFSTISYATAASGQVGAARMRHQPFIVLPAGSFGDVDGIVGYELLSRCAARLDMRNDVLDLAPNAAAFGSGARAVKFSYDDRQPQIAGALLVAVRVGQRSIQPGRLPPCP